MAQPTIPVLQADGVTVTTINTINPNGATTGANAQPTVAASDDAVLGPVTETAPASDTASSGLNGRLQRIAQRITSLIAALPGLGAKVVATAMGVSLATDDPVIGPTTETAPASDTATSGLNGRLQRLAQRLTSLIGLAASTIVATVSAVVTASSAYAAGNLVGTIVDFGACVGTTGGGVLQSVRLSSKSVQTATFKLYLFSQNPSNGTYTDKSAPGINAADIPFLIDVFTLSIADSGLGTHTIYSLDAIAKAFVTTNGQTHLFGLLITTGTPTFASTSDISVSLGIVKDNA